MNLGKKKLLAVRTFGVGKNRILFVNTRLEEIKEAITKQDIRDLQKNGAIIIKNVGGRLVKPKKHKKRSPGNVRIRVNKDKREYISVTRKLRKHVEELRRQGKIDHKGFKEMRKKIRNREFKNRSHLKAYIEGGAK